MGVLRHEPSLVRQHGKALQDCRVHRLRKVTGEGERDGEEGEPGN